jgi:FAD/FMN-containing dehydrogenase
MKQAFIDPTAGIVRIEPGVRGYELDLVVQAFKLVVPLGSCPAVGVAGYALGGGESSLTPKFGYACDNLSKVELITAGGELVTASAEQNADLFWACAVPGLISESR